ncbi:MAG: class I SAM-dependent methyltransferase [bacterium]
MLEVNPNIHVNALDISSAMIASCKKHLADNLTRITFLNQDIVKHLSKNPIYNYILTAQVIHNFPQADKENTFKHIFDALTP